MNERSREDFIRLLRRSSPRQRSTKMQTIEGHVSEDGVGYVVEELAFLEEDLTTRTVTLFSSRLCNCGRMATSKNTLKGRCQHPGCHNFTCTECVRVCKCGRLCCPRHASIYEGQEIYCNRCRPIKWLKRFFDIRTEREEK